MARANVVKVAEGATIVVRRRPARGPRVQLSTSVPADLAKRLRVFAVERELLVQDVISGAIGAVLEYARKRKSGPA